MASFIHQEGRGSLLEELDKKNALGPDWKGSLKLSKDYKKGEEVRISAWVKNTPKGRLISLNENNWTTNPDSNYPKEVNHVKDSDVPF